MKFEYIVILITIAVMYDAYYEHKYLKTLYSFKKYYKIAAYGFVGFFFYTMMQKSSTNRELLTSMDNIMKYVPINQNIVSKMNPLINLTKENSGNLGIDNNIAVLTTQHKPMKRSVSETKKKFVASNQEWKCKHCKNKLDHTFEIDHKIRLEYGGSNDVNNLIALCRNCHGIKTASENM